MIDYKLASLRRRVVEAARKYVLHLDSDARCMKHWADENDRLDWELTQAVRALAVGERKQGASRAAGLYIN